MNPYQAASREHPEPVESSRQWPYALWLFFGAMIGWGVTYLTLEAGGATVLESHAYVSAKATAETSAEHGVDGARVFTRACAACHQATGMGIPGVYPPLAGSEWVLADKLLPARIILKGMQGPITVQGQSFNNVMPERETSLDDEEVAAVVRYIRTSWGNQAAESPTAGEIEALRNELKGRGSAWTADELKK